MIGDSDVGKSSLAFRLVNDEFQQRGSTHGMQVWKLATEQLLSPTSAAASETCEILLWDFAGQSEYQEACIQLFLQDTTAALIVFDSTRGDANYAAIDDWNRRLESHASGRRIQKILIRSKLDLGAGVRDTRRLLEIQERLGASSYHEVSAFTGEGVGPLREALSGIFASGEVGRVNRPLSYQIIRQAINDQRTSRPVIFYREFRRYLETYNSTFAKKI